MIYKITSPSGHTHNQAFKSDKALAAFRKQMNKAYGEGNYKMEKINGKR